RWQGEPLSGGLLIYPEQIDIESDAARRDTLLLARGVEATVQCSAQLAGEIDGPTIRRGDPINDFEAAAPLRSLPLLLNWTPQAPPAVPATAPSGSLVGWFSAANPPAGLAVERDPARIASCRLVIGSDNWPTHLAARRGVPTVLLLAADADW